MDALQPSSLLVALLQHIELRDESWWNRAVEEIVLSVLFDAGGQRTIDQIWDTINYGADIQITPYELDHALVRLQDRSEISHVEDGPYILAPSAIERATASLHEHDALEDSVRRRFNSLCRVHLEREPAQTLFTEFRDHFLLLLVTGLGAETWHLIMNRSFDAALESYLFADFVSDYPEADRHPLRLVALDFFNPDDRTVTRYVLRLLTAHFLYEARRIPETVRDKLAKLLHGIDLKLVLDSAILVSQLSSHMVDGSRYGRGPYFNTSLAMDFESSRIDRFASELTLEEVGVDLSVVVELLDGQAAMPLSTDRERRVIELLSWLEEAHPRDSAGWARQLQRHFDLTASSAKVTVLRAAIEEPNLRKRIADDLREAWVGSSSLPSQKTLEEWRHDISLWHVVSQLRKSQEEVQFDEDLFGDKMWWLFTDDPELIAFDRNRAESSHGSYMCVHPYGLATLLELAATTMRNWDSNYLSVLRAPLLAVANLDAESEQVALRVLDFLDWNRVIHPSPIALEDATVHSFISQRLADVGSAHVDLERARRSMQEQSSLVDTFIAASREKLLALTPGQLDEGDVSRKVDAVLAELRALLDAVNRQTPHGATASHLVQEIFPMVD